MRKNNPEKQNSTLQQPIKLNEAAILARNAFMEQIAIQNAIQQLIQASIQLSQRAELRYWNIVAIQLGYKSLEDLRATGFEIKTDDGTLTAWMEPRIKDDASTKN